MSFILKLQLKLLKFFSLLDCVVHKENLAARRKVKHFIFKSIFTYKIFQSIVITAKQINLIFFKYLQKF